MDGKEFAEKARLIERLAGLTESVGPLNSHVYFGVRRRSALQPADFQRQIPKLQALAAQSGGARCLRSRGYELFQSPPDPTLAGIKILISIFAPYRICRRAPRTSPPRSPPLLRRAAIADPSLHGAKWLEQQAPYLQTFHPAAWDGFVAELHAGSPEARRSGSPGRAKPTGNGGFAREPVVGAVAEAAGRPARAPRRSPREPGVAPQICRRGRGSGKSSERCLARKKGRYFT